MDTDDRLAGLKLRHRVVQVTDQFAELARHRPADRVRDIDRGGPGIDHRLADLREKIRFGSGAVLGRKLDIGHKFARTFHTLHSELDDLALRLAELELAVQFGSREKHMDAPLFAGRSHGLAGRLDVARHASRQPGNDRPLDLPGDGTDRSKIAIADHGKTALDHVHLQSGQLTGDLEFFAKRHRGARALLTVAECRVKDKDSVLFHVVVDAW